MHKNSLPGMFAALFTLGVFGAPPDHIEGTCAVGNKEIGRYSVSPLFSGK